MVMYNWDDEPEGYDVAQVCPNGHPANGSTKNMPQFSKDHCEKCGERTITECPACNQPIRGDYWGGGIGLAPYQPPAYCNSCGTAFPWTERKIHAAVELAKEIGELSAEDAEVFEASLPDIVRETPMTDVAAHRVRKVLSKTGREVASALRDIFVDIVSESAKKIIWPAG